MSHDSPAFHQAPFQGIPQLPQYDPKILQNAPKELMRGMSYPTLDEDPYLQGIATKKLEATFILLFILFNKVCDMYL